MNNNRPLISFCIFTYNQECYVKDAIYGAFSQTYSPLEIIISDDCSTDNTFSIISDIVEKYDGCHKIVLNRNDENLGIAKHWNHVVMNIAKGDIIVAAAGDDVSLCNRVERSYEILRDNPNSMCVSFKSEMVDAELRPLCCEDRDIFDQYVSVFTINDYIFFKDFVIHSGDSRAFKREVMDKFGPITVGEVEDIFMFIRCLMLGTVCYSGEKVILRRWHGDNISDVRNVSKKVIDIFVKQANIDIEWGVQQSFISYLIYEKMKKKISSLSAHFMNQYYKFNYPILNRYLYRYPILFITKIRKLLLK